MRPTNPDSRLARERYVRIMCDFAADPVWERQGANESLLDLPVTAELRDRLAAWQRLHDRTNPGPLRPKARWAIVRFSRQGLELAREVKRQLPDWTVVYFDAHRSRLATAGQPRSEFEYEIVL